MKDHNEGGESQAQTCVPSGLAEVPFSTESPRLPSAQIVLHAAGKGSTASSEQLKGGGSVSSHIQEAPGSTMLDYRCVDPGIS